MTSLRNRLWKLTGRNPDLLKTTDQEVALNLDNLRSLFKLIWDTNPRQALILIIVLVLQGLLPASAALIAKQIVDVISDAITEGSGIDGDPILMLLLLGTGIAVAVVILETVTTLLQQLLQEQIIPEMNLQLARKSVELELEFFERPDYFDMLDQAQREVGIRPLQVIQQVPNLVKNWVTLLSFVVILITFRPWIAVVLLVTALPAIYTQHSYGLSMFRLWRRNTPLMRKANYYRGLLTQQPAAIEIRLFRLGAELIRRFDDSLQLVKRENMRLVRQFTLISGSLQTLSALVYWGVFAWVAYRALGGSFTLGDLVLFSQVFLQMRTVVQGIIRGLGVLNESALFIENFFRFLDLEAKEKYDGAGIAVPMPIQQGIEFRDVTFYYPESDNPALIDLNLTLRPGERVAIVGENGAGKSTLVKLLARLYEPTHGAILVDGVDLREYNLEEYRRQISMITQNFVRYHLSIRDNIGFGEVEALADLGSIIEAARLSGAHDFIEPMPRGYETWLGRTFDDSTQLSGGQWQKIALARAYLPETQMLILDEPTASLDVKTEARMVEQYAQLSIGQIGILITHRFSTVRLASRIIVIHEGRVVEDGTHAELIARGGYYATMFNTQAQAYVFDR